MKNIYYLALVCIIHICIVNGVRAPRGYERRKKELSDADPVPSNTTLQNTTLTEETSGSPFINDTNTSTPSSTGKVKIPSQAGSAGGNSSSKAGIASIPKIQVSSTTPAGSGADTGSVMQSVNYYLDAAVLTTE